MKRLCGSLLASLLLACIIGCSEQTAVVDTGETVTLSPSSGAFGLSQMKGLGKRQAVTGVKDAGNAQFNLGKIKASTGFYFLLYNVGAQPITRIALNINNEAFSVFPATIDSLLPGGDVGMLPIVKISAYHGTPFDGVGNRPLLPKGDNQFSLSITGHSITAEGNDTIIELDAAMELEALVFDFELSADNGMERSGTGSGLFSNYPEMSNKEFTGYRTVCSDDRNFMLTNSGSEAVRVKVFVPDTSDGNEMTLSLDTILSATAALPLTLSLSASKDSRNVGMSMVLYGNNTVSDPSKVPLNDDGNCYINIAIGFQTCIENKLSDKMNAFYEVHKDDALYKILTTVDQRYLLYLTCTKEEPYIYQHYLYDIDTDALLCSLTSSNGEITDICSNSTYSEMLTSVQNALEQEYEDDRELAMSGYGLGSERIGQTYTSWEMTGEKE